MENQFKEMFGAWIAVIGTVTSAIGSTPFKFINSNIRKNLNINRNLLQSIGNALEADGQRNVSIGNEIQSIGNVTVIFGLTIGLKEETQIKLVIAGNWTQALGGLTALSDEFKDASDNAECLNVIGNLLQIIGNSLQGIGGIYELKSIENEEQSNKEGKLIGIIGSWVQAVGSVISLIGQISEAIDELEENDK
ncbi:DUF6944 family repetitive protein [Bacillus cereus]|uniref:DUF6944 family repetitive protein n=1 Tax=Bacillus cereus TaxID=1396 RepID=UPI0018CE7660|nr:hypothetical protein [Bacillus cereus]MBG9613515.1 hypothetical protein [Bacillus cereus]